MRHERTTCGEPSRTIRPVASAAKSLIHWLLLAALIALALPFPAMAQTSAREAGTVSAQIPAAHALRGKQSLEVAKDMKVLWGDTIKTEIGSRVRVRLNDGSILNVGSQSQLQILSHDTTAQRTQLQLAYGRMRASVVRITQPDGGFQVRTTAAVAGVVGTDEFLDASDIHTTVIAMGGGQVRVTSPDARYADFAALLNPGEAITLIVANRPGEKRLATDEELGNAYQGTDSDEVVKLEPTATWPGQTIQARIVGKGLLTATGVSFARDGLIVKMTGPATDTAIPVSITVVRTVPFGTYPFTIERPEGPQIGVLIITSEENVKKIAAGAAGAIKPPPSQNINAIRGAKFKLDASTTEAPAGASIAAFLWTIENNPKFSSNTAEFLINTSFLKPGDYVIQLIVISNRGQVATQRFNLTVDPGIQPAEIIRALASGYESLQPTQFLKNFDEENFRNYSGFASSIDDSFRNQLETVRVFQRPVNCTISEEQDQAACQADFEVQFTKKDQPTEFLDANGNPFPPGVAAPPGSTQGKRQLSGTERSTIRFERHEKGWLITDYNAQVSCPGGNQVSGVNVGSCILAIGTFSSPGFTLANGVINGVSFSGLNVSGGNLTVGSPITGSFVVSPLGGFNGSINFTGSGTVLGAPVTSTFSPNPASAGSTVQFTIFAPSTLPAGFTGPTPFTFTITGSSPSSSITQTITVNLVLAGSVSASGLTQFTSPTAPLTLLANSSVVIGITATTSSTTPSTTPVAISFGPVPAGVTVSPTTANVLPGSTQPFTFTFVPVSNNFANFGIANVTVTGTVAGQPVLTTTIVLNLGTAGSLPFSLFPSSNGTVNLTGTSILNFQNFFSVFVSSQATFNQPINISVGTPPPGVTISPNTFVFTPGLSGTSVQYAVTVDPTVAQPGTYPILISGVSGGVSATTTWTLFINGAFSLSVAPTNTQLTALVLPPDGVTQTTVTVTVTSINNFAGSVNVFYSNPFGAAVTVTPVSPQTVNLTAGGTTNVVFTFVAAAGAASTFTNTTFASASSSNGFCTNCSVQGPFMTIGPAGFVLNPTSSTATVDINSTFSPTVSTTVNPLGAFGASVTFTVNAGTVPAGVTVSPTTQTVASGGQARFTVRGVTPAVVGNFAITVAAVSGAISQTYTINVRTRGQLSLTVGAVSGGGTGSQTAPLVLSPGGSISFNVSVGGLNGFSGPVTVQVFGMPSGVTAVFPLTGGSSVSLSVPPGTDTFTLTNVSAAAVPLNTITVQASDPTNGFTSNNPTQQVFFTTGSPSFILGCAFFSTGNATPCTQVNYLNLNINQAGGTDSLQLKIDSVGGYSGTVSVVPQGMPAGVTMSPNPVILAPGQATTVTFSAASPATAGVFSFNLLGNDTVTPTLASSTPVNGQTNGSLKLVVTPATTTNNPAIVPPGGQQVFSVAVTGMNGFSGSADIFISPNLATGVSVNPCCTLSVNVPAVGSVTTSFAMVAAANAPASFTQNIFLSSDGHDANFNSIVYFILGESQVQAQYVVGPSSFNASVSGATLNNPRFVQAGQQTSISVTINAIGAFTGTVFLDVLGLPSTITVSSAPGSSATIPVQQGPGVIVIQPQITGVNVPGTSVSTTLFFTVASNAPRGFIQGTLTATSGALVQSIPIAFFVTPQVTLALTPTASGNAPMAIAPGSSANLQIAALASPTFAGDVDISFSLPTGVTIAPVSARVAIGGFITVTVNLAATVTAGSILNIGINGFINGSCVTIVNGSCVTSATATIVAGTGAFSIAVVPSTATSSTTPLVIAAGGSSNVVVNVSAIGAFAGSVTVSAAFTVATMSTPTPSFTVSPGGSATFPVNIAAGAQALIGRMIISATGSGQSTSATVFISIGSGTFSLSVSGNSATSPVNVDIGISRTFNVLVHQTSGFTGTVSLTAGGFPAGVTVGNNGFLVPAGTSQDFQVSASVGATAGDTQMTITGVSGATTVNLTVFLRIRGQFSLSLNSGASPNNPIVLAPGSSQVLSVSVVPAGSFFGSVLVSTSTFSLPAGVTVTPSSATADTSTPAQFTVAVAAGTPASSLSSFNVSASGTYTCNSPPSCFNANATAFVSVATNPTFNMSFFSPLQVSTGNSSGSSVNVQLSPVGGFSGTVTLNVNTSLLPAGVTVTPASTTFVLSGFGTNINLNFVASSAVTSLGSFTADISATSGPINITQTLTLHVVFGGSFVINASAGSSSNAPIVLAAGGQSVVNLTVPNINPNITCNDPQQQGFILSTAGGLPTGVTANAVAANPNLFPPTLGSLTVNVAAGAAATTVFGVTVLASPPPTCTAFQPSVTVFFVVGPGAFSLSVPGFQTGVNINSNSLSSVGVSVNSVGNFQGTVTVSVVAASVPTGVTVTPATIAVLAGNSINFQVRADAPATAGSVSFNISATDGVTTIPGNIPLLLRGSYTLTISPANSSSQPAIVAPLGTATYTVTVSPQNGFTGTVSIFQVCCSSLPTGMSSTTSLTASPGSPGQIVVTASATAVASTPSGITFFSSSPNSFSGPGFNFFGAVGPPSFRVTNSSSVSSPQQVVINGSTRNINVQVQSLGGFSGTVDLALGALPAGLTASPQTAQVTVPPGGTAGFTFSFSATSTLSQGPIDIQLTASQGTTSVNTFFYLYAASNMALVQNPVTSSSAPLQLLNGDPVGRTVGVQVLAQGGFTGSVALSVISVPSGMTVTPLTTTVACTAGNCAVANFQFTAQTASNGFQSVDISASFSGLSAFTVVFFNVGVGSYTMSTTPASSAGAPISLNPNGTTIVPISLDITPQNGFVGTIDITPVIPATGMTVTPPTAQVVVSTSNTISTIFNFSATVSQGTTPISIPFNATANISTPTGVVPVNNSTTSFLLVNPPTFAITQTGGTSGAPLSIEQGIPPGQTFQLGITGTGTVAITFANVPTGVTVSPPTANIAAGSSATFTVTSSSSTPIGNYIFSAVGSSASQLISTNIFVNVVTPTNGFFLATSPQSSLAAPVILQPDSTLVTFLNVDVLAKGTFTGVVTLALSGVPAGVTATLTPSSVDLSVSPSQVSLLQFQTTTGLAAFGPTAVTVTGTSGALAANTPVFVALQVVSAIQNSGSQISRAPEIIQVLPPGGSAGSHMVLTLQGSNLSSITQVMTSSTKISAQLEPNGSDSTRRLDVFARPDAAEGAYTLMLVSPNGIVPVGIKIAAREALENPNAGIDTRMATRGARGENRQPTADLGSMKARGSDSQPDASGAIVTRVEPASIKAGDVVEGRLIGENLGGVTGVRAIGQGIIIEMLEATDSEIRVRFTVALNTTAGSRMLSLLPGRRTAGALVEVQTGRVVATSAPGSNANTSTAAQISPKGGSDTGISSADSRPATSASASTAPDLAVRSSDFSMSPAMPRPGDDVTFRVLLTNRGTQDAQNIEVEFFLGGANVRVRDHFNVAAGGSQSFQVQWQASGSGRFAPQVVIDPDRRLSLVSRANTTAAMPAFELFSAASAGGRAPVAMKERGQMTLSASGCQGFRFSAGTEQACNGGADMEVRVAPQGGALRVEADGVRNLGAIAFDSASASQVARGVSSTADALLPGNVYLVETRSGAVLVRVMDIRGMNAVRRAAPAAMNRPGLGDVSGSQSAAPQNNITVYLEWRSLSQ